MLKNASRLRMSVQTSVVAALVAALTAVTSAKAADKISIRLEWTWWIVHAAFFIPAEKGWYAEAGLDVSVNQGKGSMSTALLVSQGSEQIGFGDAAAAARVITTGAPMKVVGVFWQSAPYGLICRKEVGLKSPADIVGKSVGTSINTSDNQLMNAFIAMNKLPADQIKAINMPGEAKVGALLSGQVNCISGDIYWTENRLTKSTLPIDTILYADHGVRSLSNSVMISNDYLAKNADVVRRLLATLVRGYRYMLDHPEESVAILRKNAPDAILNDDYEKMYVGILKRQVHTPASEGKPLGWSAESDWAALLSLLQNFSGLQNPKEPTAYFTNDYLPKS